ncbi:MAG TPA: hypothetical protein VK070_08035 [Acidimicrobiia bacterium]|nr:hypothetical protein [Acidimicrobiia bacterium]
MRFHPGTLFAGVIYLALGVAFVFEALDAWSLSISDLRYVGPLALVLAGLAVVIGSIAGRRNPSDL